MPILCTVRDFVSRILGAMGKRIHGKASLKYVHNAILFYSSVYALNINHVIIQIT